MSNRTDFFEVVCELFDIYDLDWDHMREDPSGMPLWERLETELHNAYVAGEEGNGCDCRPCVNERERRTATCPLCDHYTSCHTKPGRKCTTQRSDTSTDYKSVNCACPGLPPQFQI